MAADFLFDEEGELQLINRFAHAHAKGAGVLYEGRWRAASGSKSRPVKWGADFMRHAAYINTDFQAGERTWRISPRYQKRGWAAFWQNDEWWAEPVAPRI
ncbi:hypothetical protein D3Y59_03350 [Hymenobacter oligotrophus]|uniref:Uncharacterized protein n=1 Tax=Hymenobacter oligotrophus TaxID=2319843 RepID=A0A3B7QXV1_9BACT|nr:hypothetical protein [Hymenobacter oligotrophus]AYA36182.1 hypothetical protein D3Y59_03350 [Hymenobacter oligotrophus]